MYSLAGHSGEAALERNRFKAHLLTFSDQKDTMSDGISQ